MGKNTKKKNLTKIAKTCQKYNWQQSEIYCSYYFWCEHILRSSKKFYWSIYASLPGVVEKVKQLKIFYKILTTLSKFENIFQIATDSQFLLIFSFTFLHIFIDFSWFILLYDKRIIWSICIHQISFLKC